MTMTFHDQIREEKLQYDINREASKISTLPSNEIRKYEYLTSEEILQSNQKQIIEQAKFTFLLWVKGFKRQLKTIEDQGKKYVETLKDLKPKEQRKSIEGIFPEGYGSLEIKNEINKIREYQKMSIETI